MSMRLQTVGWSVRTGWWLPRPTRISDTMCTKTNIPLLAWVFWLTYRRYIYIHNQTDIFISQGSTHDINQMRSYQFTSRYWLISRTYIQQSIMLYRIKNSNQYILSRSIIQILANQIFIIFLRHIKYYPLTWLKTDRNSKAE